MLHLRQRFGLCEGGIRDSEVGLWIVPPRPLSPLLPCGAPAPFPPMATARKWTDGRACRNPTCSHHPLKAATPLPLLSSHITF